MRKLILIVAVIVAMIAVDIIGEVVRIPAASVGMQQKSKPRVRKRKVPRRRVYRRPKPPLSPQERQQLLRSFSNQAINQELDHRLLTLFTLEELQAEAARRGIR